MLKSTIAALRAILLGIRFRRRFRIRPSETWKYFLKCCSLGLCFGGFPAPYRPLSAAIRAGNVGFLCCVYDVATDWRSYSPSYIETLQEVLDELAPPSAHEAARELYERDYSSSLRDDGLERGEIALNFAVEVIGIKDQFNCTSIAEMGVLLQLVDDVLDFEKDHARGEQNCLLTPRRRVYLRRLRAGLPELIRFFSTSPVMIYVIHRAGKKADLIEAQLGQDQA